MLAIQNHAIACLRVNTLDGLYYSNLEWPTWLDFLWLSITNIMIEVFKVASAQWILFYQWVWFILQRNSPESLQGYDPALGGYIIQVEITSNMQVSCHFKHAPWHLGANAKSFYWPYWRPDSLHHNEPALAGYQLLLSTIQGTQVLNPLYWRVHCSIGKAQSS